MENCLLCELLFQISRPLWIQIRFKYSSHDFETAIHNLTKRVRSDGI